MSTVSDIVQDIGPFTSLIQAVRDERDAAVHLVIDQNVSSSVRVTWHSAKIHADRALDDLETTSWNKAVETNWTTSSTWTFQTVGSLRAALNDGAREPIERAVTAGGDNVNGTTPQTDLWNAVVVYDEINDFLVQTVMTATQVVF